MIKEKLALIASEAIRHELEFSFESDTLYITIQNGEFVITENRHGLVVQNTLLTEEPDKFNENPNPYIVLHYIFEELLGWDYDFARREKFSKEFKEYKETISDK